MRFLIALIAIALLTGCKTNVTPEQQVADAEILAQVKTNLVTEMGVQTVTNISVNVTNGVVTLAGQVDSAERKARAEQIARAVPKVTQVVNNLQAPTSATG
jgi:osmotically-inducible protein OsmY